jgi:hypothetical protein
MSDGIVSAIPSELMHWASWASGLNKSLNRAGHVVNQVIEEFNRTTQEPRFIPRIEQVGDAVVRYAAGNAAIDDWVRKVGQAFIAASFVTGLDIMFEADLAHLVGVDPTKQVDDAANGASLAAQLKRAENANDEAQIQAILRQIKGRSQEFAYAFFNELGPDQTIKTLMSINRQSDDGMLQTFDNALGQASQHPNWDPNFTSALLDPDGRAWGPVTSPVDLNIGHIQLSMLKYGTFSEDFLTQSADYFFSSTSRTSMPDDRGKVMFDALRQNPNAAYNYLTGHFHDSGENMTRVQQLLENSTNRGPATNRALGELIRVAGFSDNGRADNGNQLLQAIGSIYDQNMVADDIRPGIVSLLAGDQDHTGHITNEGYIKNFAHYLIPDGNHIPKDQSDGRFTWQERLFMITELNRDGSLNKARSDDLQQGAMNWLYNQLEHGKQEHLFTYAGTLFGLVSLPARKAKWYEYDAQKARVDTLSSLWDTGSTLLPLGKLGKLPGIKKIPAKLVDLLAQKLLGSAKDVVLKEPDPTAVVASEDSLKSAIISAQLPCLVVKMSRYDPEFFPASLRGLPRNDWRVLKYIDAMKAAVEDKKNKTDYFDSLDYLSKKEKKAAERYQWEMSEFRAALGNYFNSENYPIDHLN